MPNSFHFIIKRLFAKFGFNLLTIGTYSQLLTLDPQLSKYSIGKFSYGCPTITVLSDRYNPHAILKIGSFCSFAENVTILLGRGHRTDWITTYPFNIHFQEFAKIKGFPKSKGSVIIGNDVWIGRNALILDGVNIGDGAVVGANSAVTKDIEPYTIVAGTPARIIRKRFDQETIDKLLEIKWWDWKIDQIKENMSLLLSDNIKEFIEKNSLEKEEKNKR